MLHEIADLATRGNMTAPADRQRHMNTRVVEVHLGTRKWHSVIARYDDESVLQFASTGKHAKRSGELDVKPFNLGNVIEDVAANFRSIGPVRGDFHFIEIVAGGQPGAFGISAMGLGRTKPKEKRRTLGTVTKEVAEVGSIVAWIDTLRGAGSHAVANCILCR